MPGIRPGGKSLNMAITSVQDWVSPIAPHHSHVRKYLHSRNSASDLKINSDEKLPTSVGIFPRCPYGREPGNPFCVPGEEFARYVVCGFDLREDVEGFHAGGVVV